eukprot:3196-Heterococcus_DN1.PRE.2
MSTVIERCSLAGIRVSRLDDLYLKFADKSVQQLRAREDHAARIEKQKAIGDQVKEDHEYDEGIASERCIQHVAVKIEADRKTKRLREEMRQEKNAARKRQGLQEMTAEDDRVLKVCIGNHPKRAVSVCVRQISLGPLSDRSFSSLARTIMHCSD